MLELKGMKVSISEDYSLATKQKRKKPWMGQPNRAEEDRGEAETDLR